jgi:hypothetical protein
MKHLKHLQSALFITRYCYRGATFPRALYRQVLKTRGEIWQFLVQKNTNLNDLKKKFLFQKNTNFFWAKKQHFFATPSPNPSNPPFYYFKIAPILTSDVGFKENVIFEFLPM